MEMIKSIKEEVKEGQFSSVSEFIRHLIRLYNTEKLARETKRDRDLFKKGKLKAIEVQSFKDVF